MQRKHGIGVRGQNWDEFSRFQVLREDESRTIDDAETVECDLSHHARVIGHEATSALELRCLTVAIDEGPLCSRARDVGESVGSISQLYPPAPLGAEVRPDREGFLSLSPKGFAEDFAQDLPEHEIKVLWAAQCPTNAAVFGTPISNAAWKTKPSWCVVADEDRAIPPALERAGAERMNATMIDVAASHLVMVSHPKAVADFIEKAATSVATR